MSSPGRITLPVKKLVPIVRALSSSDTIVELTGKDRVKITSGSSVFQVAGLPADQFPPISNFAGQPTISINQDDLGDMLRKVSYAQSSDENRYILNGVFFEFAEGKLTVVATDGRRLAKCERKLAGTDKTLPIWLMGQLGRPREAAITNVVALAIMVITMPLILLAWRLTRDGDASPNAR